MSSSLGCWKNSGSTFIEVQVTDEEVKGQILCGDSGWSATVKATDGNLLRFDDLVRNCAYLVRLFRDSPDLGDTIHLLTCTKPNSPLVDHLGESEEGDLEAITVRWGALRTAQVTDENIHQVIVKYALIVKRLRLSEEGKVEEESEVVPAGTHTSQLIQLKRESTGPEPFEFELQVSLYARQREEVLNFGSPGAKRSQLSSPTFFTRPPSLPVPKRASPQLLELQWQDNVFESIQNWIQASTKVASQRLTLEIGLDAQGRGEHPTYPVVFPENMNISFESLAKVPRTIVVPNLFAKTWYWLRLRCHQSDNQDSFSECISLETPAGRPSPPTGLHASYTLYNDEKRMMRHIFIKVEWEEAKSNGAELDEYIILRSDTGKDHDWGVVLRTQNSACVLSGLVPMDAFDYKCFFVVRARNKHGLSESQRLCVHIRGQASSSFLTRREQVLKKQSEDILQKKAKEEALLEKTRQLVRDYLDSDLIVNTKEDNSPASVQIAKIGGVGYIHSPKSPKSPHRGKPTSPRSPRSPSPRKKRWKTPQEASELSPDVIATSLSKSLDFPAPSIPTLTSPISSPTYMKANTTKTLTSEVSTFSPRPPMFSKPGAAAESPRGMVQDSPYRQPLKKSKGSKSSRTISRAVYKEMGLPDFSKLKGVHCELQVQERLKKGEVQLVWTFGYENKTSEEAGTNGAPDGVMVGHVNDPETDFIEDIRVEQFRHSLSTSRSETVQGPGGFLSKQEKSTRGTRAGDYQTQGLSKSRSELLPRADSILSKQQLRPKSGNIAPMKNVQNSQKPIPHVVPDDPENQAALKLQSTFRMHNERKLVNENRDVLLEMKEKRKRAAIKLTAFGRMVSQRGRYLFLLEQVRQDEIEKEQAAKTLQGGYRSYRQKRFQREEKAATTIQTGYRKLQSKKIAVKLREEHQEINIAATKIQSQFRAIEARKQYEQLAEEDRMRKSKAALQIQKSMRARTEMKRFEEKKKAALKIQARFRTHQEQLRFQRRVNEIVLRAAVRLQTRFRGHNARKQLELRKRFQIKSVVRITVSRCGHRAAVGTYETMGVTNAAQYVLTSMGSDDSYVIERSTDETTRAPIWTLKWIKASGEAVLLYANTKEGPSIRPPRHSWQPVAGPLPVPTVHWKSSESYLHQMSMMNRASVVVTDSGSPEVHGKYLQSGVSDGVPQYVFQRKGCTLMLLRTPYGEDGKIWVLAGSIEFTLGKEDSSENLQGISEEDSGSGEDGNDDEDEEEKNGGDNEELGQPRKDGKRSSLARKTTVKKVYYANFEQGSSNFPPTEGWIVAQNGVDPVPLFVRQQKLTQVIHA